jgi:CBS domain-containing protein
MFVQANTPAGERPRQSLPQVDRDASVLEASRLMRESGQTEVLVTHQAEGMLQPFAILTAKDIVSRVVAAGLDPAVLTTGDIAWSELPAADAAEGAAGGSPRVRLNDGPAWTVLDSEGRPLGTMSD